MARPFLRAMAAMYSLKYRLALCVAHLVSVVFAIVHLGVELGAKIIVIKKMLDKG